MFTAPRANILSALLGLGLWLSVPASAALAQEIGFTGLKQDTSLPVQVESDTLSVDQASGIATFTGAVKVVQGDMTITAATARVEYAADGQGIERLFFSGRVTVSTPSEAAEADEAVYTIPTGEVVMTGDVLLTQGPSTIAGQKLVYNLDAGQGTMEGRVQTVFVPGKKTKAPAQAADE